MSHYSIILFYKSSFLLDGIKLTYKLSPSQGIRCIYGCLGSLILEPLIGNTAFPFSLKCTSMCENPIQVLQSNMSPPIIYPWCTVFGNLFEWITGYTYFSRSILHIFVWPQVAAACSGVQFSVSRAFTSAPYFIRTIIIKISFNLSTILKTFKFNFDQVRI